MLLYILDQFAKQFLLTLQHPLAIKLLQKPPFLVEEYKKCFVGNHNRKGLQSIFALALFLHACPGFQAWASNS